MSARKLWKVVQSDGAVARPESLVKAYGIYVANARAAYRNGRHGQYVEVHVDERDGHGWRLHERVDLADGVES